MMSRFPAESNDLARSISSPLIVNRRIVSVHGFAKVGFPPFSATQPLRQERLLLPHTCRSQCASGSAQLGGKRAFARPFER
jgi:hypothetical protein